MIDWIQIGSVGLILSGILIGCGQQGYGDDVTVHPRIVDQPDRERIELSYTNETKHALCFSDHFWPTASGALDRGGEVYAIVVGDRRFRMESRSMGGYCIGDECDTRVVPGATIFAFLLYDDFHLPVELQREAKRLEYSIRAYQCDVTGYPPKLKAK